MREMITEVLGLTFDSSGDKLDLGSLFTNNDIFKSIVEGFTFGKVDILTLTEQWDDVSMKNSTSI